MTEPPAPTVVKVGGGLLAVPGALDAACAAIAGASRAGPVCVVPGGGPFADSVRRFDREHRLSDDAAHWMAVLGMDQYAHALADRIAGAAVVDRLEAVAEALRAGAIPVLAPFRWLRAADLLPHGWEITSDSIAAVAAGSLGSRRLVLLKPVAGPVEELVDAGFELARPADLMVVVLAPGQLDRLAGHCEEPKATKQSGGA